jgi:hypothetical protein
MIAHGLDWAFLNTGAGIRPPYNSIITRAVIGTPEGRRAFREREGMLFTNLFKLDVFSNRVSLAVSRLTTAAHDSNEVKRFQDYGRDMLARIAARYAFVSNQLALPEAQPLQFDSSGFAQLFGWRSILKTGDVVFATNQLAGRTEYGIRSSGIGTIASWRTKVQLSPARYRFTGDMRALKVVADSGDTNAAICLRISGDKHPNKINAETTSTTLKHEFEVTLDGDERELVCELRAHQGEVWFDARSLRLERLK